MFSVSVQETGCLADNRLFVAGVIMKYNNGVPDDFNEQGNGIACGQLLSGAGHSFSAEHSADQILHKTATVKDRCVMQHLVGGAIMATTGNQQRSKRQRIG
jgi:hypothetical protein